MSIPFTNPRQVRLKRCSIWTPTIHLRAPAALRGDIHTHGVDIAPNVVSLDIYESIFQNTITARLRIRETHGYPEYFPLVGVEFVFITFAVGYVNLTTNAPEEKEYTRVFRVHRLYDQTFPKNEERVYTIDLVTPEFFKSLSSRITRRFGDITCRDAVIQILQSYLDVPGDKLPTTSFEGTDGKVDVVIPNYTPLQAINFFALLSLSTHRPNESNFVFFETLDGFFYTSVRKLIADGKSALATNPKGVPTFRVNANQLTGNPTVDIRDAYNSIIQLHQDDVFDVLKDISNGMLRSKMLHLDFFARKWNEEDSRYTETFKKTTHLSDYPFYPNNFDQSVNRNVKLFVVPTNTSIANSAYVKAAGETMTQQRLHESIMLRNRQFKELQHMRTLIEVPGQPSVRAGSVVVVHYPSSRALAGVTDNPSIGGMPQGPTPYHSGPHLITHVRHAMTQVSLGVMEYTMHLEVVRDSFAAPQIGFEENGNDKDGKAL